MTRRRIAKEKIEDAMVFWLLGDSARIAAKKARISNNVLLGNIRRRPDAEILIEKFHVTAIRLKKEGLDINDYLEFIRTSNFLLEMGLNEKYILPFMTELAQFAYDFHCSPDKMVRTMIRFIQFMEEGGFKTPTQLAEYLKRQVNYLERVRNEATKYNVMAQEAILRWVRINRNRNSLEQDPSIGEKMAELEGKNKELNLKLAEKNSELEEFKRQEKLPKFFILHEIVQGEGKRLGRKLGRIVRPYEIYEKAQEIVRHPSRYSYLFLKCELPPSLDPDSSAHAQEDDDDTDEVDSSDNSDPLNLSSDRTKGTEPDTDIGKKDIKFGEEIDD